MSRLSRLSRLLPDDGRVAVAVATTGATAAACLAQGRAAAEAGADVVELRADLLDAGAGAPARPAARDLVRLGGALAGEAGAPVLLTVRTAAEGGGARLDDGAYRELLRALAEGLAALPEARRSGAGRPEARRPAALDIELARGRTAELVARAHAAGLDAVVSCHDFEATPQDAVMLGRLRAMAEAGADAAKLAVMPRSAHDVARLLGVTARASEELDVPVVTMSMGALGAVSRVSGAVFGSALTFATAGGASSAPGQLPIGEVREVLRLLGSPTSPARRDRSYSGSRSVRGPASVRS